MKVRNKEEAWYLASRLFPTGYALDMPRSEEAGYDIYTSTIDSVGAWISDLDNRLELNYPNMPSENIWIEEEGVKMTVSDILRLIGRTEAWVCIHAEMMGIKFTARHSKDYFLGLEDKTVLNKEVTHMYVQDDDLHLTVK